MISPSNTAINTTLAGHNSAAQPRHILTFVENDRMAGSVPKWSKATQRGNEIALNSTENSLQQLANAGAVETQETPFGFGDVLDMINPLHHIPIVGHMYREMSGDEIKPSGQIIGGAVFGGAIGAGAGLVNVIAQAETGKDVSATAFGFMRPQPSAPMIKGISENIDEKNGLLALSAIENVHNLEKTEQEKPKARVRSSYND